MVRMVRMVRSLADRTFQLWVVPQADAREIRREGLDDEHHPLVVPEGPAAPVAGRDCRVAPELGVGPKDTSE